MKRLRARRMTGQEAARFRNALREFLGLAPIQIAGHDQEREISERWRVHCYEVTTSAVAAFGRQDGRTPPTRRLP